MATHGQDGLMKLVEMDGVVVVIDEKEKHVADSFGAALRGS